MADSDKRGFRQCMITKKNRRKCAKLAHLRQFCYHALALLMSKCSLNVHDDPKADNLCGILFSRATRRLQQLVQYACFGENDGSYLIYCKEAYR